LIKETQATEREHLILVQTERERHASLFKELNNLNDVFAGVCE
jgi:hypothetical protein